MTLATTRRRYWGATPVFAAALLSMLSLHASAQVADLTIVKDSKPADDTPFPFFLVSPFNDTTFFTLMDPSDPDTTFLELAPGTYEIWETLPKFWALSVVSGGIGINTLNDSLTGTTVALGTGEDDSLTVTLTNTKFGFDVQKVAELISDEGAPGVADPGDSLKYTIRVIETVGPIGNLAAAAFEFFDVPDPNTTLVWGTVEVMAGFGSPDVIDGNDTDDTEVSIEASVLVGDTTTIMYKTVVNNDPQASTFCNQAELKGRSTTRNTPVIPSDDPDDPTSAADETCVPAGEPVLPVELSAFEAIVSDGHIEVTWITLSETNNAGFSVEMREETEAAFVEVGFVEGRGTTLEPQSYRFEIDDVEPGEYAFRLKQIDLDGAFQYSPTVRATIEIVGSFYLSEAYPNPFNPSTTLRLGVNTDQPVSVAVFDALGKRVSTLYDGTVERDNVMQLRFDAGDLPSGLYFVRASGSTFAATRTVMLLK